jgi:iron-sulfur cluster assembly protein/iron-sulfur cluster insertion protein
MEQLVTIGTQTPQRAVELTDGAVAKIFELVTAEDDSSLALRMAVRPGGCSGFSYEMFFDSEVGPDDIVEEFGENVRVLIDNQSVEMLRGATLDYKDGLMGAGFAINNPNVNRSCGCGSSFS